jgi:hypothetical protein
VIGGTTAGSRNIIAGNGGPGVEILDDMRPTTVTVNRRRVRIADTTPGATGNQVIGNFIGVNINGVGNDGRTERNNVNFIGNTGDGVFVSNAAGNVIGGGSAGTGNIIAGNGLAGIRLLGRNAASTVIGTANLLGQTVVNGQVRALPNGSGNVVNRTGVPMATPARMAARRMRLARAHGARRRV